MPDSARFKDEEARLTKDNLGRSPTVDCSQADKSLARTGVLDAKTWLKSVQV